MAELEIPAHAGELTVEWLTESLRSGGTIGPGTSVTSFESTPLGEGEGFIGDLARVTLSYDGAENGAPTSLIAKFPTSLDANRQIGEMFGLYEHEIRFYNELADEVPVRKPAHYFSAMDPAPKAAGVIQAILNLLPTAVVLKLLGPLGRAGGSRRFIVLIEDLAPARVGDQVAGLTVEEAELALRHLAKMHAHFWNDPRLEEFDWIVPFNNDSRIQQGLYKQSRTAFVEEFSAILTDRAIEIGEWLVDNGVELLDRLTSRPYTLLHGDFRPDNLFFGDGKTDFPLAMIDWQSPTRGAGPYDVAYFIGWSINAEDHGAIDGLIESYHSTLVANGVTDYSLERCKRDYVLGQVMVLHRGIFLVGQLDLSHERGQELVQATLKRSLGNLPMVDLDSIFD
ncbi:MAG: phosphotransferase [Dehalococcoidia bacterium]